MKDRGFDRAGFVLVTAYFLALGWYALDVSLFPRRPVELPPGLLIVDTEEGVDLAMAQASRLLADRPEFSGGLGANSGEPL